MMVFVGPLGSKLFDVLGDRQRQIMRTRSDRALHRALAIPWTVLPRQPSSGSPVRQSTYDEASPPPSSKRYLGASHPLTIFTAHAFMLDHLVVGRRMTLAASNKAVRVSPSPTFVMRPTLSTSPDWYRRGVRPR
jgi:hypothetical protein